MSKKQSKAGQPKSKVINFYEEWGADDPKKRYDNPCALAPQHPFRSVLVGKTGTGKSNLLMNIIRLCDNFHEILLFTGSDSTEFLYKKLKEKLKDKMIVFDSPTELIKYANEAHEADEAEAKEDGEKYSKIQRLCIFDDFIGVKKLQDPIDKFSTYCRKLNCSLVLLTQNFYEVNKTVRKQVNYTFLMGGAGNRDLKAISRDALPDLKPAAIAEMYMEATKEKKPTDVFMIDTATPDDTRRCRIGFDRGFDLEAIKEAD